MAKRAKRKQKQLMSLIHQPGLVQKIVWSVIVGVAVLFGLSNGYPVVAQGQIMEGVIKSLIYGGGAFAVLALSLYINRKAKGL